MVQSTSPIRQSRNRMQQHLRSLLTVPRWFVTLQQTPTRFAKKIARIEVGLVGGTTDLAAGLALAGRFRELAAVVVVTDGQSNDNNAALQVAATLKSRSIDIICIGTDDADRDFLKRLATRSDLATHVSSKNLRAAITDASRFLPQG